MGNPKRLYTPLFSIMFLGFQNLLKTFTPNACISVSRLLFYKLGKRIIFFLCFEGVWGNFYFFLVFFRGDFRCFRFFWEYGYCVDGICVVGLGCTKNGMA